MQPGRILSLTVLGAGVLYYVPAVAGVLFAKSSSPSDPGLVSTAGVLVLLGALGLFVTRTKTTA